MSYLANKVLMIRPEGFHANVETAQDNIFQSLSTEQREINQAAQKEFDSVVSALEDAGVEVCVVEDTKTPETPDAIFPNNRLTFHENGLAVAYPMKAKNRRRERTLDVFAPLLKKKFFALKHLLDYTEYENQNLFLEGTGSMILDRKNKKLYAALSQRTDSIVLKQFCQDFEFEAILFEAGIVHKKQWQQIYHTNVMLSIGEDYSIIALAAIKNKIQLKKIKCHLTLDEKKLIEINIEQMKGFCGNVLQLQNAKKQKIIAMSETAYNHFNAEQISLLEKESEIISIKIPNIEHASGGSVRCMLAEVF